MRSKRWLFTVAMCLCLVLALGMVKFFQIRAAIAFGESFPEPSETVAAKLVEPELWQPTIKVIGTARAQQQLTLRNELGGLIRKVGFESGANVEKGDVLLQLDVSSEQAELDGIKPEIVRLQADAKRYSDLKDTRAASRQQIERVKADLAVAKARASSINAAIAKKTIVAPFAGRAGLHLLEEGEFLAPNTVVTVLVGDTSQLRVDFAVPQQYANLAVGTPIVILSGQSSINDTPAVVSAVEPSVSMTTRMVNARAQVNNETAQLKPGALVNVRVPIGDPQTVFILPSTASRKDTFGDYVFRLERDKNNALRALRQPITIVARQKRQTVISKGLEIGMLVATKGAFKLREGILVYRSSADDLDAAGADENELLDSELPATEIPVDEPPLNKQSSNDEEAPQ